MSDLDPADIGEMLLIALAARDSGFKRVQIDPGDVVRLCERIRTLEAELAEHEKWKPLVELARRLREFGSLRTESQQLYDCIDRITGLRRFHADGTWHTGPACENCEKGPTDEA